ncbi:hypothetical protein [Shewanella denitrificans]|jgi:hypothetical protein|nr:hypothetical protein [Shewanella denitrificans]
MKRSILPFALLAMIACSFSAVSAVNNQPKYNTTIVDSDYILEMSKYQDYRGSLKVSDDHLNSNVYRTHQKLLKSFTDLRALKSQLEPEIKRLFDGTGLHYRWFNFDVTGPIEVKLSGTASGAIKLELSKFSLRGQVKAEKSWYLNVYGTLTMNNAYASGEIDLATGKVKNLTLHSKFNFDFDSTIKYLMPTSNFFITELGNYLIDIISEKMIASYDGYQTMYSLDKVVPAYKYVYQGIDIGWELRQQLLGMINGEFIKITMKELALAPSTRPYACYEPGNVSWNSNFAEINISNKAFFKLSRTDVQKCEWNGSGGHTDY